MSLGLKHVRAHFLKWTFLVCILSTAVTSSEVQTSVSLDADSRVDSFCASRAPGLYCHPFKGRLRVHCPSPSNSEETMSKPVIHILPCQDKYICRSHKKLHFSSDKTYLADAESLHGFEANSLYDDSHLQAQNPQCVPEELSDLDAFCEDKIHEFVSSRRGGLDLPPHLETLRKRYSDLLKSEDQAKILNRPELASDLYEGDEVLVAVRHCNPFSAQRNQLLDCVVVQRQCDEQLEFLGAAPSSVEQTCIPTKEIKVHIENCPTFDVCRKYDEEEGSDITMAKCIPPVDAMCFDRFWSEHVGDVYKTVRKQMKSNLEPAVDSNQENVDAVEHSEAWSNFRFCDPFKFRQQFECTLKLQSFLKPFKRAPSVLTEEVKEEMTERLRHNFPDLYGMMHPSLAQTVGSTYMAHPREVQVSLRVVKLQSKLHKCPADTVRHGERDHDPNYIDPWLVHEGSTCKQLTNKLSRCLPRPMLDVPNLQQLLLVPTKDGQETKQDPSKQTDKNEHVMRISSNSPILNVDTYMGFCLGKDKPGQYCVPGTPELAVLCPQGIPLHCRRPRATDEASWTDVGQKSERCVQHFGVIPGQGGNPNQPVPNGPPDVLRQKKIIDLFENELSYGWYASCSMI